MPKGLEPNPHCQQEKNILIGCNKNLTNKSEPNEIFTLECTSPIDVVPYPVKEMKEEKITDLAGITTGFNFLTIALFGPRKNLEKQIEWFLEEFKDDPDVGLVLKAGFAANSVIDRDATESHLKSIMSNHKGSKCKLYLLHGSMTEVEINSLYNHPKMKAYLTFTHGEGYGLPIFEAAYNGLPIIATDWSGHLDFLTAPYQQNGREKNKKLFARVDYTLKEIPKSVVWKDILQEGSRWANPIEISAKKQMRKVYRNHGVYVKWAKILKENILKTYKKDKIESLMAERILETLEGNREKDTGAHTPKTLVF